MLYDLIFISSFLIAIVGLLLISAMISNRMFINVVNEVNLLANNFKSFDISVSRVSSYALFKRVFDILFSILSLFLLFPIILIIIAVIIIDSKGPVFYGTKRIGKHGRIFYSYKFRTMKSNQKITYKNAIKSDSDPRVTKIGLFLRKTSLDELPELFNVLKGNMSMVGTSVAREFEYDNISEEHKIILRSLKPGLTNLWIVSKDRSKYNYERRLIYDLYYVKNHSFKLDISIIYKTIVFTLGESASF